MELPRTIRHASVFGPYAAGNVQEFTSSLVNDFRASALLEDHFDADRFPDFIGTFDRLKRNLETTSRQTIIILLDLDYDPLDIDDWRSWFSSIRTLEHNWEGGQSRLHFLTASFWNHNLLDAYYREIRLSFPYTFSHNYFLWDGISEEQMDGIVHRTFKGIPTVVPYGSLLHEITGGHPGAAVDILNHIPKGQPLTIPALLSAVKLAASNGRMGKILVAEWSRLPDKFRAIVRHLLLIGQIPVASLRPYFDGLCSAGLLTEKAVAGMNYGVFHSWFVELVARYHLKELGIEDADLAKVEIAELSPPIASINREAYQIINEIETLARNFSTVRMAGKRNHGEPLLLNRAKKYDKHRQEYLFAYERAQEWKENSRKAGLPVELNPLIAYLSIKDLPKLIDELAEELGSEQWKKIATALESTGYIRDAVMHNQIIDDAAYARLFDLRASIYEALRPEASMSS
jgi:hypothetical protein